MKKSERRMPQRRERSFKRRKPANTASMYKRAEQIMEDVSSASKELSAEDSSFGDGVNSLYEEDDNLLQADSERTEMNAENENSAANEGINCRERENMENFLTLPEEANKEDYSMYEELSSLFPDAEYKEICDSLFMRDDFSCNNTGSTGLQLDKENGGLASMPMEADRQSVMEQNEGRQQLKNDESMEIRDTERYEEKATSSKNGTKKPKKKKGKKTKTKFSIAERKAQALLMKVLQELCGGEYHVRVSREVLRDGAKSMQRTDRVTNTGVLDTALVTTVNNVMNGRGDKFMRGYKESTGEMEYWMQGPNGEGSTPWMIQGYLNFKEQNIKLQEDNLMIKEENEMLKEKLEMVQKMHADEEEKVKKMEKQNQELENQLRKCKDMLADLHQYTSKLERLYRINS